ncbi:unnamed protein product [Rhizophagus irregularis]|nr:unnamed protein product [Rhizophagus irregularis]
MTKRKKSHNFWEFFTLVKNDNNKSNAKAVCICCSQNVGGLAIAQVTPGCFTSNKARLCRNHLANCENFKSSYSKEEITEILSRSVPEDSKKKSKNCNEDTSDEEEEEEREEDFNLQNQPKRRKSSTSTISSSTSSFRQQSITNFCARPMSINDRPTFEFLFLRMIVSNGLPFTFLENEDTQAVFNFILPGLSLPNRKAISGRVLKKCANTLKKNITDIAKKDIDGVTATFDGWTNVKAEHIWEVVLLTSQGQSLIWGAHDISGEFSRTENVIQHIKNLMLETNNEGINIKAFISDSAGEYTAARKQLRREYLNKVFLPCMAHQMNLVFGDIFKESVHYKRTSAEAVRIVSYFHKSPYFTGNLRDEQTRIYNKTVSLLSPGDTRWNSYYFCFHSILKTKVALKFISAKFNEHRSNVIRTNGIPNVIPNNTSKKNNNERKLPDDIADIINDNDFWLTLVELQNLLYPLCGFLNKLQKDTASLYEVIHCFAYVTKIFNEHTDSNFSEKMVERMEKRWKQWEQPLLILSMVLHPSYKVSRFRTSTPNLSMVHLGKCLDPYDDDSFAQFKGQLVTFWEFTSGIGPELAKVAIRIHGICVNSASVERLWSSMGYLHTNQRNRLKPKKVLEMAQIRGDIFYNRNIKSVQNGEKKIRQLHIATPITPEEESDNSDDDNNQVPADEEDDDNNQVPADGEAGNPGDNENEPLTKEDEECWDSIITEWINNVEHENQFDNADDATLLSSEWDTDFELGGRTIHPADDDTAKWILESLFISNLESPTYLGTDDIFTDAQ